MYNTPYNAFPPHTTPYPGVHTRTPQTGSHPLSGLKGLLFYQLQSGPFAVRWTECIIDPDFPNLELKKFSQTRFFSTFSVRPCVGSLMAILLSSKVGFYLFFVVIFKTSLLVLCMDIGIDNTEKEMFSVFRQQII